MRNYVAKNCNKFNKPKVMTDKKRDYNRKDKSWEKLQGSQ